MLTASPQCTFSLESPPTLSQKQICYHWLSVYGIYKIMHCGILIKMLHHSYVLYGNHNNKDVFSAIQTPCMRFNYTRMNWCILVNIPLIKYTCIEECCCIIQTKIAMISQYLISVECQDPRPLLPLSVNSIIDGNKIIQLYW